MLKQLAEFMQTIWDSFFSPAEEGALQQQDDYYFLVEQARLEWQHAKERFDQISDPDLIDHAIYDLGAAERRYIYLLKKAREEGANLYPAVDEGGK